MTTVPRQRAGVKRHSIVYGINILDPETGKVRLDYVGQTQQRLRSRENQHRDDQPWNDLIVGSPFVLEQGVWDKGELDRREIAAIRRLRPRYNYDHNQGNPNRVEKWRARDQRWARDDAAGRPRWVPPELRTANPTSASHSPRSVNVFIRMVRAVRSWAPWKQKVALWSMSWSGASLVVWGQFTRHSWFTAWGSRGQAVASAVLVAAVLVWSLTRKPRRK
jgi:hypothetical protein